jgi:hypothetical protein
MHSPGSRDLGRNRPRLGCGLLSQFAAFALSSMLTVAKTRITPAPESLAE